MDHLPKATGAESAGLNPHHIPDGKARILSAEVATRLFSGWWAERVMGEGPTDNVRSKNASPFSPGNTGHCERVALNLGAF